MNVSQTSGASAAWMLQRLFQSSSEASTTTAAEGAGRQNMPGVERHKSNSDGGAMPSMSRSSLSGMISLQMEKPAASEIASDIVSGLDTDGDGEVSADEITAAFSQAGLETDDVDSMLTTLDADGSGTLSAAELTSAIGSNMEGRG